FRQCGIQRLDRGSDFHLLDRYLLVRCHDSFLYTTGYAWALTGLGSFARALLMRALSGMSDVPR
ncbi:hypothetical protein J8J21_23040, partial [Mycobacterium tuberculosis]|nr:hypothetical protein [Mycobacterium tuberculosis]